MRSLLVAILALASLLVSSSVIAQVPELISYQVYLTNPAGIPIDGTVDLKLRLYSITGALLWSLDTTGVEVNGGITNLFIGAGGAPASLRTVPFNGGQFLTMRVNDDPIMVTQLVSAPFALGMRGMYAVYREDGTNSSYNVIGGASNNVVAAGVVGATIGGGGGIQNGSPVPNSVLDDFATVGGGRNNTASGSASTIGGGAENVASDFSSTVGGGYRNDASGNVSTIGGGSSNDASGVWSTIGGGAFNAASDLESTVSGGESNTASGKQSTVAGGRRNTASAECSVVPGGCNNTASAPFSFAAGYQAEAIHEGTFVWSDRSSETGLASTAPNQFLVRAAGGLEMISDPSSKTGVRLMPGSGSWQSASSVHLKRNFEVLDVNEILRRVGDLDIQRWRYTGETADIRHVGPTSEDFYAAFALGGSQTSITTVDGNGVALAAIQGLYELVQELQAEVKELRAELR